MLPPWLSESDITDTGYEAPVENLPQDDVIPEEKGGRRLFGRRKPRKESAPDSAPQTPGPGPGPGPGPEQRATPPAPAQPAPPMPTRDPGTHFNLPSNGTAAPSGHPIGQGTFAQQPSGHTPQAQPTNGQAPRPNGQAPVTQPPTGHAAHTQQPAQQDGRSPFTQPPGGQTPQAPQRDGQSPFTQPPNGQAPQAPQRDGQSPFTQPPNGRMPQTSQPNGEASSAEPANGQGGHGTGPANPQGSAPFPTNGQAPTPPPPHGQGSGNSQFPSAQSRPASDPSRPPANPDSARPGPAATPPRGPQFSAPPAPATPPTSAPSPTSAGPAVATGAQPAGASLAGTPSVGTPEAVSPARPPADPTTRMPLPPSPSEIDSAAADPARTARPPLPPAPGEQPADSADAATKMSNPPLPPAPGDLDATGSGIIAPADPTTRWPIPPSPESGSAATEPGPAQAPVAPHPTPAARPSTDHATPASTPVTGHDVPPVPNTTAAAHELLNAQLAELGATAGAGETSDPEDDFDQPMSPGRHRAADAPAPVADGGQWMPPAPGTIPSDQGLPPAPAPGVPPMQPNQGFPPGAFPPQLNPWANAPQSEAAAGGRHPNVPGQPGFGVPGFPGDQASQPAPWRSETGAPMPGHGMPGAAPDTTDAAGTDANPWANAPLSEAAAAGLTGPPMRIPLQSDSGVSPTHAPPGVLPGQVPPPDAFGTNSNPRVEAPGSEAAAAALTGPQADGPAPHGMGMPGENAPGQPHWGPGSDGPQGPGGQMPWAAPEQGAAYPGGHGPSTGPVVPGQPAPAAPGWGDMGAPAQPGVVPGQYGMSSVQPAYGAPGQYGVPLQGYPGGPVQGPRGAAGYAGGPAPSLDDVPLRRATKAPGSGWRRAVHHMSGGAINPGMSAEERRLQELVARIRQPVRGDYRIAVLSLKGGVGKTTTTMGLGSIFSSIRGDRVIAVDANPDFGTLSQRVPLQTRSTVRDLLLDDHIQRYSDVRRHTSQGSSRLEVLASERDPAASEAFNEEEYRAVARILQRFYNIILTDCGTGLMHSAMAGVLDLAHSLVLISSSAIDGARSAAATLDWLSLHGHDHLVRNAVVVINLPRPGAPNVGINQLRDYFLSRCRAVHIIPYDAHLGEGAEIDLHRLSKPVKRAYVELAATVADDFGADHRHYRG
nr:MinD/ParA family protein [Nocardia tengchongensis]